MSTSHFYKLGIPKSTLKQWKICGPLDYFSISELDLTVTPRFNQVDLYLKSYIFSI